jgi:PAS domain S-box-containing protein
MGRTRSVDTKKARPARIELLVVDLMNELLSLGPAQIDDGLQTVLERLGLACGFDRTFLFCNRPDGTQFNSHEWVAPGVTALKPTMQMIIPQAHPTWHSAFREGRIVAVHHVEDMPADAPERQFLERIGVRASLMVPLLDGARVLGLIGYDSQSGQRPWSEDEVFLLRSIGRAIASVLLRGDAELAEVSARQHLLATLRALPDLVIEVGSDGKLAACHSAKLPWLSGLVHAGLGRHVGDVLPPDLATALTDLIGAQGAKGAARIQRVGFLQSGIQHWYEVSVAPLDTDGGACSAGIVAVIRDISSTVAATQMVSYREGQFTAFFEMCPHPILLSDFDTGEILDGNRAFKSVFGLDPLLSVGLTVSQILPDDAAWVLDTAITALKATGSFGPVEATLRRSAGTRFPAILRGFMSVDPSGRRLVWALIEDVAEIRANETALRAEQAALEAARARLVAAIEALDDGFAVWDADDRLVQWNTTYTRIFSGISDLITVGALYDDLLRAAIERGIFGGPGERDEVTLQRRLDRPLTEIWDGEDRFADGRMIWVRERATPERETVGLYEDVTARRQADRRLQQVIEGGDVAIWEWDADRGLTEINDRWRGMLGFARGDADAPGIDDLPDLLHPGDVAPAHDMHLRLFAQGVDEFDLLNRLRHRSGRWLWMLSRGRVLARKSDGSPRLISGVTLDVSARIEAEQRLTRLIDGARVGTWEYHFHEGRTVVNDRWAEIVGYRAVDLNPLQLDRWLTMIHPDDSAEMLAKEAQLFGNGEWMIEHEMRLRHRDGHWVWVLSRGQVIEWDDSGRPMNITGVHLDISAGKALEAELARERDTLARIMETSVSGITAMDGQGRVVFANKEAETILGRAIASLTVFPHLRGAAEITDLSGRPVAREDLPAARVLAGAGIVRDQRMAIRWPDGTRRVVSVNAAPLSAHGTDLAVVCSWTDITDAVDTEDRLRAARTAAEAASRAKTEFLANMSHEIRTPLNGVLGMAYVLEDRLADAENKAMVRVIRDSGEHLLGVINDILDLAKIEAGRLTLDPRPINLADLSARIEALHGIAAASKGITLVLSCNTATSPPGHHIRLGDEQRILQILHNLIGNAIKFTDTGEVRMHADVSSPTRLMLEIHDTGIGMSEAEMTRVFEDFTQGDGGITRRYGGTGLGLPIVRRLAGLMQGEVTLQAAAGQGLTVRLDLGVPVTVPETAKAPVAGLPPVPPMRVLVAEDNATNRLILQTMLGALGVGCTIVSDGDEAVRLCATERFDVHLLDIAMPRRDGISTLLALNAQAALRGHHATPAIAVTANAMTHQVEEYLSAGFAAFVAKPIRLDRLADALIACHARHSAFIGPA